MRQFKNIFLKMRSEIHVDFRRLVLVRRAKMIREGFEVNSINWEHYARVLEAKNSLLNS